MINRTDICRHFWLPAYNGEDYELCVLCDEVRPTNMANEENLANLENLDRDSLYEKRKEWIEAHNARIWQVLEDEKGEFVWEKSATRDGEDDTKPVKKYLPEELTKNNVFKKHA